MEFPPGEGWSEENGLSLLDYGCGSGILSLAALKLGRVRKVVCVDIEAEALVTADANFKLNGYQNDINDRDYYELFHTRQVEPYCFRNGGGSGIDICVANILIGQLVRSSMVSALMTNIRPNGLICFSGIRPSEVEALKSAYDPYLDWLDHQFYAELDAQQTEGSIESYGFDVGRWTRVVGKVKPGGIDVRDMSEMAIM
jgi:ribosomal protein L11 methylase PrmA